MAKGQTGDPITVQSRRSSLARSHQPQTPPSENQAGPKALWTLQDHQRNIPCGVSTPPPRPAWGIHDVFHASLLSPYHETTAHGPNFSRPPPDLIGGEEEYEVERIINHRRQGRSKALQYLIKWKGYPESDNTWEPAHQVHAPDLIKAYQRRNPSTGIKGARDSPRKSMPTRLTPTRLTKESIENPPFLSYWHLPKVRATTFEFKPQQPFRHFWFLWSEALPQQHAWEHSYFCRKTSCPFHS
jgi:hypothetical protein